MTDDLISRQAAIDALAKFVPYAICDESTESYTNGLTDAYNLICQLPSAQPERKKAEWNYYYRKTTKDTFVCNGCGACFVVIQGADKMNYCPNCGAKMDEEIEGRKK